MQDAFLSMEEVIAMGDAIAETAVLIDVATHRFLTQVREFDRLGAWHRAGAVSCAHWLSWRIGIDLATAREKVRVANRLVELPRLAEALRAGEISYSKVRAMSRVATPENEKDLLTMARVTTGAQLAKICRLKARVNRIERSDPRAIEECKRYVLQHSTDDGMVSIQVRLLPDEAARVMRAFEVFGSGNLADGAVAVAELALVSGRTPRDGRPVEGHAVCEQTLPVPAADARAPAAAAAAPAERPAAAPAERPAAAPAERPAAAAAAAGTSAVEAEQRQSFARSARPPVEVVLHVSAADLEGQTALGDGVPADVSRRLLCDCGVVPMLEDQEGRVIDVGRKKRTIPAALRRALETRDGGCRFPGCTNRLFTDGHHLLHWIDGGETTLANTILLCRRHHRYVHEYGFTVEQATEDGEVSRGSLVVFRAPDGTVIPPQGARPQVSGVVEDAVRRWAGRPITPESSAPGWDGQQVDYDLCLEALRDHRGPAGAAGTW